MLDDFPPDPRLQDLARKLLNAAAIVITTACDDGSPPARESIVGEFCGLSVHVGFRSLTRDEKATHAFVEGAYRLAIRLTRSDSVETERWAHIMGDLNAIRFALVDVEAKAERSALAGWGVWPDSTVPGVGPWPEGTTVDGLHVTSFWVVGRTSEAEANEILMATLKDRSRAN